MGDVNAAAEQEMAAQSRTYPNWPLIPHAQLKGWYDSHKALRAQRDALVAEVDERDRIEGSLLLAEAALEDLRVGHAEDLQRESARRQQAIDALREIRRCDYAEDAAQIARDALVSLGEQP